MAFAITLTCRALFELPEGWLWRWSLDFPFQTQAFFISMSSNTTSPESRWPSSSVTGIKENHKEPNNEGTVTITIYD